MWAMPRVDWPLAVVVGIFHAVIGPFPFYPLCFTLLRYGRDFAANIGIRFHTPEEFFLKEAPKPFARDFDPATYLDKNGPIPAALSKTCPQHPDPGLGQSCPAPLREILRPQSETPIFSKENMIDIVMFCGSPGSGKSTFYWKHVKPLGYERVNQDILKTV